MKLKSGKAPGVCGINAKMLKAGGMVAAEWLYRVIMLAWEKGKMAEDWKKAVIVPLHKKGSKMVCSNYRGISLLSVPAKFLHESWTARQREGLKLRCWRCKGNFRRGRGCVDQIFTIRQL